MQLAAAFFDLDRTLVDAATEKALAVRLRSAGALHWSDVVRIAFSYLRYDHGVMDYDALKRRSVHLTMAGKPVKQCTDLAAEVVERLLASHLFPEACRLLEEHRNAGHRICIVSSAVDLVVRPCARILGADAFFATTLGVEGNCFTGAIEGRIHAGAGKAEALRDYAREQGIDLDASYAYGDHHDDRHMLGTVGHPVAVNPDGKLHAVAREQGWRVARWRI